MKLVSLLLTSLLLTLGGAGATAAVNNYVRAHVGTATLASLDVTPTPTATPTPTPHPRNKGNPRISISTGTEKETGE